MTRQPNTDEYWKFHTKPELGNWKNGADVATAALNRVLSRLPNPVHIDADGRPDMSLPFTEDADVLERDKLEKS